jgi:hypothetical protein
MFRPMDIQQNLCHQGDAPILPGPGSPILLREQRPFAEREAPELRLTQAKTLTLKAPEGVPGDPAKGLVSGASLSSDAGAGGLAACHACKMSPT